MSKVTSDDVLADYKSDEDEDYVPDAAADEDEEDDGPTYDDDGKLITKKSSRKRKRPQMTLDALSQQQSAPQRGNIRQTKKKTPTVGAAVISDDEDEWTHSAVPEQTKHSDGKHNAQASTVESVVDAPRTHAEAAPPPLPMPSTASTTRPSAPTDIHSLLASYNKKSAQSKTNTKKVLYPWETQHKNTTSRPQTSELDALLSTPKPPPPPPAALTDSNIITITTTTSYAGEVIEVKQELVKGSEAERRYKAAHVTKDNLSQIVDSLTGKRSLNTLDKSRVDWTENKRIVGDADELKQFTKDGFVQRQTFLIAAEQRERDRLQQQYKMATKTANTTTTTMIAPSALDNDDDD